MSIPSGDDPYAAAVTRLLDLATRRGFALIPAGKDGSLWAEREGLHWHDTVFLNGSGRSNAVRARSDRAPGEDLFINRVSGTALSVLHTVVYGWPPT